MFTLAMNKSTSCFVCKDFAVRFQHCKNLFQGKHAMVRIYLKMYACIQVHSNKCFWKTNKCFLQYSVQLLPCELTNMAILHYEYFSSLSNSIINAAKLLILLSGNIVLIAQVCTIR